LHPDAQLVEMFRGVRQDARSDPQPTEIPRVFTIDIGFDGAGALPVLGQCQVLPLGLIKARVVAAAIVANGIGSATIDLRHGTFSDATAGLTLGQMYGATGVIPTLTLAATAVLDITEWTINLQPTDVLVATLTTVSSVISGAPGAMTCVTLSLYCRHLKFPAGGTTLTDSGGDTLTTTDGTTITLRS
jgi:hypothetical protein